MAKEKNKKRGFMQEVFFPFMKQKQHWVFTVLIAFALALLIAGTFFALQMDLVERHQLGRIRWQLQGAQETVTYYKKQASSEEQRYAMHYNDVARAAAAAYEENPELVTRTFKAALFDVDEAYLVDETGKILASDGERPREDVIGILERFDEDGSFLVSEEEKIRALFSKTTMGQESYFEGETSDGTEIILIKKNTEINESLQKYNLADYIKDQTGTAGMHLGVVIGESDLYFVDPDTMELVHGDTKDILPDYEEMENGASGWHEFHDARHFVGKVQMEDEPVAIIGAVDRKEVYYRAWTNAGLLGAAAFILLVMLLTYTYYRAEELARNGGKQKAQANPIYAFIVCSVLLLVLIAADVERFYSAALETTVADETVQDVREMYAGASSNNKKMASDIYTQYVKEGRVLAAYLGQDEKLTEPDILRKLLDAGELTYLAIFENDGSQKLSTGLRNDIQLEKERIVDNEGTEMSVLEYLNNGAAYAVGRTETDQLLGDYNITVTMPLLDEVGSQVGFLQLAGDSKGLKATVDDTELPDVLDLTARVRDCTIYLVDAETNLLTYASDDTITGSPATEVGFKEADLSGDVCKMTTIRGRQYFVLGTMLDGNTRIYICQDDDLLGNVWVIDLVILLALVLVIYGVSAALFTRRYASAKMQVYHKQDDDIDMVSVDAGEGASKRTVAAYERWKHMRRSWKSRTAINKALITAGYACVGTAVVGAILLAATGGWGSHMTTRYVLSERWNKGLNIFSLTYVLTFMVASILVIIVMRFILNYIASVLSPRGETICRMVENLLTYLTAFMVFFVALYQMGVDTTSLVASVGILALVIGLGARDLMTDFISGAFAIFDGEFQVGDTISVGNTTGTVSDIGIRTTKVIDFNNNVIVINNRNLSNVVNKTRDRSMDFVTIRIDDDVPLERLKAIFEAELPKVDDKYEELIKAPHFDGIVEMKDLKQTLQFSFLCMEKDRWHVRTRITEELIRIFRENDIKVK